jgi:hypothetical protein
MPKILNVETLPPRLKVKYLQEHGLAPPQNSVVNTTLEDTRENTATFPVSISFLFLCYLNSSDFY